MHPANKWLVGLIPVALLSGAMLWEGKRNDPYLDLANILTVCYGHTGNDIQRRRYSDKECEDFLQKDLIKHSQPVLECIHSPLSVQQYTAFVLMAFNIGTNAFCSSTTAKLFNEGRIEEAGRRIAYTPNGKPNWSYAGGKFVQGLHNRRVFEMNIYFKGVGDVSTLS